MVEISFLSITCFCKHDFLNISLRDVFVSGLRQSAILVKLFKEDGINLNNTLKITLIMEKAAEVYQILYENV